MAEAVLRLGKNTEQRYADATKPHKGLDRYAFVPLPVRFTDSDIDQARAAGVLIEFAHGRPIIVEHSLYRELVKSAINRTHDELRAKAAAAVKNKQAARATEAPADPLSSAKRERDMQLRELTDRAHGANLDLGHALIHNLTSVDATDVDVARFFALCGRPHRTNYAARTTMPTDNRAPMAGAPRARRDHSDSSRAGASVGRRR
jgi:hypothetical protein